MYDLDLVIKKQHWVPHATLNCELWSFFHPHTCRVTLDWILLLPLSIISFWLTAASLSVSCWEHAKWNSFPPISYHVKIFFVTLSIVLSISLTYANSLVYTFNIENGGSKTTRILCVRQEGCGMVCNSLPMSLYLFLHNFL